MQDNVSRKKTAPALMALALRDSILARPPPPREARRHGSPRVIPARFFSAPARRAARSIRGLFPLRQPRPAQAFVNARALGVEGRVAAIVHARICLHGEAGINFLQ